MHAYRCDVTQFRVDIIRQLQAKLAQHIGDRLAGELHLVAIARAIEANH